MIINVTPIGKPRMTRSDKWKLRDVVVRYRMFKDELRREAPELQGAVDGRVWLVFILPMPESWSKKKIIAMDGKPHQQKPDSDNMLKAFLDATMQEDCEVYESHTLKLWGRHGLIYYGEEDYARISQAVSHEAARPSAAISAEEVSGAARGRVAIPRHLRMRGVLPGVRRR